MLLSQLNRNIENRSNKRPLLSDLRESGCISILDTPCIKKKKIKHLITKAIKCFSKFYRLKDKEIQASNSRQQYIYGIASQKQSILHLTHNHKILVDKRWQKTDQFKQKNHFGIKNKIETQDKLAIELNILNSLQLACKNTTYDLAAYEYCNFSVHKHIIHNSIEQDADLILMLYQDTEEIDNKKIDIVIAKHRNGPVGSFRLLFYADNCKFNNIENDNFMNDN